MPCAGPPQVERNEDARLKKNSRTIHGSSEGAEERQVRRRKRRRRWGKKLKNTRNMRASCGTEGRFGPNGKKYKPETTKDSNGNEMTSQIL